MQEGLHLGRVAMCGDQVILHVARMAGRIANALDAADLRDVPAELPQRPVSAAFEGRRGPVEGIHVLAQQRDFPHALRGQAARLHDEIIHGTRKLRPPRIGHHAKRAELVAAFLHGHKRRRAIGLTRLGQRVELFERLEFGFQPVAHGAAGTSDHFRQFVIGLRAEHEVHERLAAHDFLAFGLRDASGDGNRHPAAGCLLHPLELAEFGIDLLRRLFANMTGVQHDQIGGFRRVHGRIAERTQYVPHAL